MFHFERRHHFIMDQFLVIELRHHFIMDHFELRHHHFEFRHHFNMDHLVPIELRHHFILDHFELRHHFIMNHLDHFILAQDSIIRINMKHK